MLHSARLLNQSNLRLQDELRDTMKAYGEEKSLLRAQLANLRLDLSELHHDSKTITTDDTGSHFSLSNNSEAELKRLADFDGDTNRSLQLPSINNITGPDGKSGSNKTKHSTNHSHRKKDKDQTSKNLRFMNEKNAGDNASARMFLENPNWETRQESQKFHELQRNQEVLRSIGRAHLKEKRQSLIRLPTISSAKKRTSLWDSGKNVSRPKGKSTLFELHPYVDEAIVMKEKHFRIPSIEDPQRSEIMLKSSIKRPEINKRKVQFERPRDEKEIRTNETVQETTLNVTEANSLNTSIADVSLEDNTLGNITFDDDKFKRMMNKTTPDEGDQVEDGTKTDSNSTRTANDESIIKNTSDDIDKSAQQSNHEPLPPLKIKYLAKKNLELHNMNSMRVSPLNMSTSSEIKSCRDSDKTVGTKFSQMSLKTEQQKTMYLKDVDPRKRNQALSDIMFAVRSRMRENEEAIRFGQTPRPDDYAFDDYLVSKHGSSNISTVSSLTPRWVNGSPRKTKASKKGLVPKADKNAAKKRSNNTVEVQSYLRKMYRQRKTIDRMTGSNLKFSHFAAHKPLRMVAQQA